MVNEDLLALLVCPMGKAPLRREGDSLICTRCGTIVEFENERIEELQDRVAEEHDFTVTHHKLELYGLCSACKQQQSHPNRQR